MTVKWMSVTEVAQEAGLSEITAKRYVNQFSEYLDYRIFGRFKKYSPETVRVMTQISSLDQEGLSITQISEKLNNSIKTVDLKGTNKHYQTNLPLVVLVNLLELLVKALNQISVALDQLVAQEVELTALREEVKQLRQRLEQTEDTCGQKTICNDRLAEKITQSWWKRLLKR